MIELGNGKYSYDPLEFLGGGTLGIVFKGRHKTL